MIGGKISNTQMDPLLKIVTADEIHILRGGRFRITLVCGEDPRFFQEDHCTNSCCSACCSLLNLAPQTPASVPGRSSLRSPPWIRPTNFPLPVCTMKCM